MTHDSRSGAATLTLLCALACAGAVPATVAAAPIVLVNDNFNSTAAGAIPSGWTKEGTGGTVGIQNYPSIADSSLWIDDTSSSAELAATRPVTITPGLVTYEYKIRFSQRTHRVDMSVMDDANATAVRIFFTSNGIMRVYNGSVDEQVRSYSSATWYSIKVTLDTYEQRFSLWVNGALYKQDMAFLSETRLQLSRITFQSFASTTGAFHIDNFLVQTEPDKHDQARERWVVLKTGGALDLTDPDIAAAAGARSAKGLASGAGMMTGADRGACDCLWQDLPCKGSPNNVMFSYDRLNDMAVAYRTPGSYLAGNPALRDLIVDGISWLVGRWYNEQIFIEKGNDTNYWSQYEWGIPQALNDVLTMMYGHFTRAQVAANTAAMKRFSPDCSRNKVKGDGTSSPSDASNRVVLCKVAMVRGFLDKTDATIVDARNKVLPVLAYVTDRDGFYRDGSFIQHDHHPYNGGYGLHFIDNLSKILLVVEGTPDWSFAASDLTNLWKWVYDSFEPFVFRGAFIDSVRGRAVARHGGGGHAQGGLTAALIATLAQIAPSHAANFKSIVKEMLRNDTYQSWRTAYYPYELKLVKAIMNDSGVTPRTFWAEPNSGQKKGITFIHGAMDRVLHRAPSFMFGVAMSSHRIADYESTTGENLNGWNTAYGMTYVMNDDQGQYEGNYWATQDPYRRAGTTVDTVVQRPDAIKTNGEYFSSSYWAGGASFSYGGAREDYGVAGMDMIQQARVQAAGNPIEQRITAKKSWFMFDEEIVALGSGITCVGPTGCSFVETIVENRKLNAAGSNTFRVNNVQQTSAVGVSSEFTGTNAFAHLAGSVSGGDIGYYFPGTATVDWSRTLREGDWSGIGPGPSGIVKDHYLEMHFEHTRVPNNTGYAYALLPGMTASATATYAAAPEFTILEASNDAHGVRETTLGCTGVNFWKDVLKNVGTVTSNRKASVMVCNIPTGGLRVAVADPTQQNTGTIQIDIDGQYSATTSVDPEITVSWPTWSKTRLTVNVASAKGRSFYAKLAP
jgi:hyaluronate lyase